ncbi:ABC transporter ATP-binding protein [Micrococcus sp.]|uniref:ABC transporter ATP-binding protein n=1 Tax=Micrococcus sp. TaxID=1271 RepID=UPI0026DC7037|nr:ABC transporter ATP-binding protein [Micrococcus sp.]MDO4240504.1 ABC transporter ATP-binding protein [Micrococcus sp.]
MPQTPVSAPGAPALRLSGVHRSLGRGRARTEVLRCVDFTVRGGAVTVLLGPNGAGKSTTLGLCHGSDRPDAGTVRVFGEDPWRASADLRARIGVMWQEGGLPPSVTARRFVRHVASLYRAPLDPDALLDRLRIGAVADRPLRRLSGGQRQRAALAAAVVGAPDLLFLDEPTAGLDPETRPVVHEVIREHTARGAAVLLTTHLLDDAERLADEVAILRAGRVVRAGTLEDLTRVSDGDVLDVDFGDASPAAVAAWADAVSGRFPVTPDRDAPTARVAGVRSPAELEALAATWTAHGLFPARLERAILRLERLLQDAGQPAESPSSPTAETPAGSRP